MTQSSTPEPSEPPPTEASSDLPRATDSERIARLTEENEYLAGQLAACEARLMQLSVLVSDSAEDLQPYDGSFHKPSSITNITYSPGRGRSLWHGYPRSSAPTMLFMVAESVVTALSAWQKLDPETQPHTQIASTAGGLSERGKAKLTRLIRQAQEECRRAGGGKLILVDASDVGEDGTAAREGTLAALAAGCGAHYERWAPPEGCQDWNDAVKADRRAQEAASEAEAQQSYILPPNEPDEPEQKQEGPRLGRRGR